MASRRDRDRIVPDTETGSYKRTMSPNGHALPNEIISEPQRVNSRETIWPLNRPNKNNNNLLRRASMNEKQKEKCDDKEDLKKSNLALPDVLPMNVKILGQRSHQNYNNRPTQLSLSPLEVDSTNKLTKSSSPKSLLRSPPSSPPKSPPKSLPFSPLRATNTSSPRSSPSVPISSSVIHTSTKSMAVLIKPQTCNSTTTTSSSPKRSSPVIKAPLSPSPPLKLSPLRNVSVSSSSPPISPTTSISTSPKSPPSSPKDECPQVIEGLQMIQRSEVVLRVNATTTDASSQTEKDELPPTPLPSRKKLQEEIECEKLSEDFINHLPTSDRLKDLLGELDDRCNCSYVKTVVSGVVPGPDHKKPTDYVQGLFRVDVTSRPRPANSPFRSRTGTPSSSPPPTLNSSVTINNSQSSCKLR